MDGENHARPRRERGLHVTGVEITGVGIDVHEDGLRPQPDDAADRGVERVGRGDDLVAGPQFDRHQRGQERVAARRDADRVFATAVFGDLHFQSRDFRAQNELLRL